MSHIFDALQKAEDERRGVASSSRTAATELLERAEREARVQRNSDRRVANVVETAFAGDNGKQLVAKTPAGDGSRAKSEPLRAMPPEIQTLHLSRPFHDRLVAISDPTSPAAEAFRLLCVRLRHLQKDRPVAKLLISSTTPAEGKSLIAANLACTLAAGSHQKVLLLDGDLRRPSQSKIFQIGTKPGLSDYFQDQRKLTNSIYRLEEAGIWILPAGQDPGRSPDLIESAQLTSMAAQLSAWFDWIIIDSPPVLPLADTSVWQKMADGLLLVARRGVTAKRKLKRGTEAIDQKKLIGTILNSSTRSTNEDYYYYQRSPADSGSQDDR